MSNLRNALKPENKIKTKQRPKILYEIENNLNNQTNPIKWKLSLWSRKMEIKEIKMEIKYKMRKIKMKYKNDKKV